MFTAVLSKVDKLFPIIKYFIHTLVGVCSAVVRLLKPYPKRGEPNIRLYSAQHGAMEKKQKGSPTMKRLSTSVVTRLSMANFKTKIALWLKNRKVQRGYRKL